MTRFVGLTGGIGAGKSEALAAFEPPVKKAQELQAAGQTGPSAELLALNRTTKGLVLQLLVTVVILLIVVDMVWKPGA